MTKKNVLRVIDTLFWLLIAFFPLAVYLIQCINADSLISVADCLNSLGFAISTDNIIYTTLEAIFGVGGGMLELVSDSGILLYATYFITIMLLHFIIDCLLIIVRWSHNLLDKASKE